MTIKRDQGTMRFFNKFLTALGRLAMLECALLLGMWVCVSDPADAQWQVPDHAVPIGNGAGVTGFASAAPGTAGYPLASNGASSDPSFQQLITAGIANNAVTLAKLATQATNTILGNATSGTAVPTALAIGSCDGATKALSWTTNTGFGCNSAIEAAALSATAFANPSASIGLTANNGTATTAMRSDASPALSQAISPTMTGNWLFRPTTGNALDIQTASNSQSKGFIVNQTGPNTGTLSASLNYNSISINSTNVGTTTAAINQTGFLVSMADGGANAQGIYTGILGFLLHNTASSSTSNKGDHVAIKGDCASSANDGGTDLGSNALGTCFGLVGVAQLASGATNYAAAIGVELNPIIRTGGTAKYRWAVSAVSQGDVNGSVSDAAYEIGSISGAKFLNAILLDNIHGQAPIDTTGCVICSDGSANTIATFADLFTYTISGDIFRFANLRITGAGLITDTGYGAGIIHSDAGGAFTSSAVVSADLNITTTSCTNQFVTAISAGAVGTCTTATLASAQFANQGITTTVLHGNASGNPSWGNISTSDLGSNKIGLANGGTNADLSATGGASQVLKQISAGAAITVGQLANTDITGLGTMSTQNANAVAITGGSAEFTATSKITLSANAALLFWLTNTNAGASATTNFYATTNAGTFIISATSTAGGSAAQFAWSGSGNMLFDHTNAAGGMLFRTGAGPTTALTIDVSQNATLSANLTLTNLAADTALTDRTVCQDTTSKTLYYGTGALGICLGTSGAQFKTAFAPMKAGIDELMQIKMINYRYRAGHGDGGARMQYGTTAQIVEGVLPDLVGHNDNGESINYDWGSLLFVGLHAIQQLKADNDNLRAEVVALKRANTR